MTVHTLMLLHHSTKKQEWHAVVTFNNCKLKSRRKLLHGMFNATCPVILQPVYVCFCHQHAAPVAVIAARYVLRCARALFGCIKMAQPFFVLFCLSPCRCLHTMMITRTQFSAMHLMVGPSQCHQTTSQKPTNYAYVAWSPNTEEGGTEGGSVRPISAEFSHLVCNHYAHLSAAPGSMPPTGQSSLWHLLFFMLHSSCLLLRLAC